MNSSKQICDINKQLRACTKEEEANSGRGPKRKTHEILMKLKILIMILLTVISKY